ncbi:hypothetical protein AgCh_008047 [Apium graveolens]
MKLVHQATRNAVLENQVIELEKIKLKCLTVESELEEAVKKVEILSKQLESEQEDLAPPAGENIQMYQATELLPLID